MNIVIGILIPFIGTSLGSAMVFFMKDKLDEKIEKILVGFASGVMSAALIWSLIIPSINFMENSKFKWWPATVGFMFGIIFLLNLDNISYFIKNKILLKINKYIQFKYNKYFKLNRYFKISKFIKSVKLNKNIKNNDDSKKKIKKEFIHLSSKNKKIFEAITIHNIPEGMAIGVIFAGVMLDSVNISIASAISLALGIAIQNIPEGSIISMPAKVDGNSKYKSFLLGVLSGIVEPIAACITLIITNFIIQILPYILAFAAGSMMYVVIVELIPDIQNSKYSKISTIGFSIGFLMMMILDVTL